MLVALFVSTLNKLDQQSIVIETINTAQKKTQTNKKYIQTNPADKEGSRLLNNFNKLILAKIIYTVYTKGNI